MTANTCIVLFNCYWNRFMLIGVLALPLHGENVTLHHKNHRYFINHLSVMFVRQFQLPALHSTSELSVVSAAPSSGDVTRTDRTFYYTATLHSVCYHLFYLSDGSRNVPRYRLQVCADVWDSVILQSDLPHDRGCCSAGKNFLMCLLKRKYMLLTSTNCTFEHLGE